MDDYTGRGLSALGRIRPARVAIRPGADTRRFLAWRGAFPATPPP